MKNALLSLSLLVFSSVLLAQSPASIPYQAVARDLTGNLMGNHNISVQFTVHDGSAGGTVVYQERQSATTNKLGLFNLSIGAPGATVVSGTFSGINWASGAKYLEVGLDPAGGSSFTSMGTSQMQSVPYALYAGSSAPSGSAGGDLTGTYPNPNINNNAVTYNKIQDASTTSKILGSSSSSPAITELSVGSGLSLTGTTLSATGVSSGNLTETGSSVLTVTGGTGSVIGSGTTIQVKQASGSQSGYLSSTDYTTFSNKAGGSGTSNYVARWTTTGTPGTLDKGVIQDNNTSVGIGSAPSATNMLLAAGGSSLNGINATTTRATAGSYALLANGVTNNNGYLGYVGTLTNVAGGTVTNPSGYFVNTAAGTNTVYASSSATNSVIMSSSTGGNAGNFMTNVSGAAGLIGQNSSGTGTGLQGLNTAASGTGAGSYGIYGQSAQAATSSAAIWGNNTNAAGWGGVAFNTATAGTSNGIGILGQTGQSAGVGVEGANTATNSSTTVASGVLGYMSATTTAGSFINACSGVGGNLLSTNGSYSFGVYGYSGSNLNKRTGGVLGYGPGASGALGYANSSGTVNAAYGFGLTFTQGSSTGMELEEFYKMYPEADPLSQPNNMVGLAMYGGVMGGWVRGLVYGEHVKGKRYGLYVDGTTYTNKPISQLIDNGTDKRTVTYSNASMTADVYTKGTAELVNGQATITFEKNYSSVISERTPVIVTVSPLGETKGVYVTNVTANGFTVKENGGGNSSVKFSWIAVGSRSDAEGIKLPTEVVAKDFDEKMNGVMFNENNKEEQATPIWWDGQQVRFDAVPEEVRMAGVRIQNRVYHKAEQLPVAKGEGAVATDIKK